MLEGPTSEHSLVLNGARGWGYCRPSHGLDRSISGTQTPRQELSWARFYDLNIDPKLLMHLLPLS